MKRVLHIVTYMGRGGLETMLMNYYRHIDRTRLQFDFLVHRDFEADYDKEILELGSRIYRFPRLIPWSGNYRSQLTAFFRQHPEYRIVHVHQDCLSSVALQCAKEAGVPVRIGHCHSSHQTLDLKYIIKLYYMRKIPEYATLLLACSRQAGEWMFSGADFQVLNNAIAVSEYVFRDKQRQVVRKAWNLQEDDFLIGHVGQFRVEKNHGFLVDVFFHYQKCHPEAKLLLVGGGGEEPAIREKVKQLGMEEKVIFAGVRSDVPHLLQAMDVFVFPSLFEGLGISAIEAQTSGLPCLISDKVPEECVLTDGLVWKSPLSDSPEKWAEKIDALRKIPRLDRSAEIRKAGYDIGEEAGKLERLYYELEQERD